jgi:uncharacterized protein
MSEAQNSPIGTIGWVDLTVPDADRVRDFYADVVGWTASAVDMGGYSDYCMNAPASGQTVAGVCHARGPNAAQPGGWMVYLMVADLEASLERVAARGGEVVGEPRQAGQGRFCVIRDPSGALCGLYQAG